LVSIAANARVRVLLCFVMAFLGAAAIDLAERDRRLPLLIGIVAVAAALLAVLPSLLVLALATWSAAAVRTRRWATMFLLGAIVAELWVAGGEWNPVVPAERMYPRTSLIRRLEALRQASPSN